jgi:hypothetical protein
MFSVNYWQFLTEDSDKTLMTNAFKLRNQLAEVVN